ncbi:hypothetical protein D9M68_945140 [compost metagenome]
MHTQRPEHIALYKISKAYTADPCNDLALQQCITVVVRIFGTRLKIETGYFFQAIHSSCVAGYASPVEVRQSAGILQQVFDTDAASPLGQFGQVLRDLIVE